MPVEGNLQLFVYSIQWGTLGAKRDLSLSKWDKSAHEHQIQGEKWGPEGRCIDWNHGMLGTRIVLVSAYEYCKQAYEVFVQCTTKTQVFY